MREPIHSLPLPTRGACFVMFFRTIKIHHHQGAWVGQACFKGLTQTNERESCGTSEQSFLQEPISTKCIESRAPISFSALLVFVRQHHANILEEARWCKGTFFEHQPWWHELTASLSRTRTRERQSVSESSLYYECAIECYCAFGAALGRGRLMY